MFVSIVICTYNRVAILKDNFEYLKRLTIPEGVIWEVVVVDNNSQDATKQCVESIASGFKVPVIYRFEEKQGISYARNSGIRASKGDLIAFIDDDVFVTSNWLAEIVNAFKTYDPDLVGGKILVLDQESKPAWFSDRLVSLASFDLGDKDIIADQDYQGLIGTIGNMCFKKEVFERFGLFREDLGRKGKKLTTGEETEYYWRMRMGGAKCVYYPSAVVHHFVELRKMTKSYVKSWYYNLGVFNCVLDREYGRDKSKQLLGVPRWRYRTAAKNLLDAIKFAFNRNGPESFHRLVLVCSFWGYFIKRQKIRFQGNDR